MPNLSMPVSTDNESSRTLLKGQTKAFAVLAFASIIVAITEYFFPNFFNYEYFFLDINAILYFVPLFIYAIVLSTLTTIKIVSTNKDDETLGLGITISFFAGIWEELAYRCLFICTSMIGIVFINWLLGTFVAYLFIAIFVISFFALLTSDKDELKVFSIVPFILTILFSILLLNTDPLYWFYDTLVVPVVNFVTLGYFESIFYGEFPKLFVFGMIAANASFRDGHKYQGPIGTINSWIIGFIFMYCMINYGLITAIIIHIIYDLEVAFVRFFAKKLYGITGVESNE